MGYSSGERCPASFQILALNDLHGWIVPGKKYRDRPVGGAAVLASHLCEAAVPYRNRSIIVHAGDLVGASPIESALLGDEPAIGFLSILAAHGTHRDLVPPVISVPGNHEFDKGVDALFGLIRGNAGTTDESSGARAGARFPFLCANITDSATGQTLFGPSVVVMVDRRGVAFVGATIRQTPELVIRSMVKGVHFDDEAAAVNAEVERLVRRGIRAIVVVIHQGGTQEYYPGWTAPSPPPLTGPIVDIVSRLHDEVDVVVTGHTHSFTNAVIENARGTPMLVVQALPHSMGYADIRIDLDRRTGDIIEARARIEPAWADEGPGLRPDMQCAALESEVLGKVGPKIHRRVGSAAVKIGAIANASGESALGNLVADAHRQAMRAEIAFMNRGGLRAEIDSGDIEFREVFNIHPFGNRLTVMHLTGEAIREILEQQWRESSSARILQVSGLSYTWDSASVTGRRTVDILVGGTPLDSAHNYRVAVNEFLAEGGDGFTAFLKGKVVSRGITDCEAVCAYLVGRGIPVATEIEGRIRLVQPSDTESTPLVTQPW